jgi:hypothetical protein
MATLTRRFIPLGLVAVLGLALASTAAQAQQRLNGPTLVPYRGQPVNKNYLVAPGVTLKQWSYNQRQLAKAYSNYPPYAYGYNPYPPNIYTTYPTYPNQIPPTIVPLNPYSSLYNPYAYSPIYGNTYSPYNLYGLPYLYP